MTSSQYNIMTASESLISKYFKQKSYTTGNLTKKYHPVTNFFMKKI